MFIYCMYLLCIGCTNKCTVNIYIRVVFVVLRGVLFMSVDRTDSLAPSFPPLGK